MESITVVMLDDDAFLLKALKRTMQRLYPAADIVTFSDLEPFWCYLREHPHVDLVISDYLMPHMHGLDVLERCTEENSYPVRALLTGDMTLATMMRQPNVVHAYLAKPFNAQDVQALFEAVADLKRLPFAASARTALGAMTSFPVSGGLLQKLKVLVDDDNSDAHEIAAVVAKDPVIMAKVLQLANSAYLGFQRQTSSIDEAVSRLGTKMLMAIVTSMAIAQNYQMFVSAESHQRQLDIASDYACCVKAFAKECGLNRDTQEELFATALLSFIGKMILLAEGSDENTLHNEAMLQEYGADYQLISAYVMRLWGYKAELCELIMKCHDATPVTEPHLKPQHQILFIAKQILFHNKKPLEVQSYCTDRNMTPSICHTVGCFNWAKFCNF
ncbi:HDOD domain-containing protein [Alkalimonas sp. MEB108]|uniref:HDOD domain-containing protein n=1 Tax=Alkalimonas cellulosilytica TaxID=3058395 RepID=A0ABU7J769_9GAMM|nr:HDOD domain-containing protein [Alkalimonas sp. MEB108]MEE2002307.1 HDOD domain-containing protein [Alkalimonas sp. MEB108]